MFRRFSDFIKGYVQIEVNGKFCEKFLNLIIRKGIIIKNIHRISKDKIYLTIYIKDFLKIKSVAKTSSCKIKIAKKKGAHFTVVKYRRRIILLSGIAICALLVYTMSNIIFTIEIYGNKNLKTEYIQQLLNKNGIKPFVFNKIKGSDIAKSIMSENENIAWIGIEVSGSKVMVDVVEKADLPEVYNPEEQFNIISDADGIISYFHLKKGFSVVQTGETVKKGQLLVSGVTDSQTQDIRYLNPEADIKMISWITEKSQTPLTKTIDNLTKNKVTNIYLKINDKTYGITRKIPFKYYSLKTEEKDLFPGVKMIIKHNIENIPEKIVYKDKELFEIERKKLYNKIVDKLTSEYEVLNIDASYSVNGDVLVTTVTCAVEGPFIKKIEINK